MQLCLGPEGMKHLEVLWAYLWGLGVGSYSCTCVLFFVPVLTCSWQGCVAAPVVCVLAGGP